MHHHVLGMHQHSQTTAAEYYEKPLQHFSACTLSHGEKLKCSFSGSNSHQISILLKMSKQNYISLGCYISQQLRYFTRVPYLQMKAKKPYRLFVNFAIQRKLIQVSLVRGGIFISPNVSLKTQKKASMFWSRPFSRLLWHWAMPMDTQVQLSAFITSECL